MSVTAIAWMLRYKDYSHRSILVVEHYFIHGNAGPGERMVWGVSRYNTSAGARAAAVGSTEGHERQGAVLHIGPVAHTLTYAPHFEEDFIGMSESLDEFHLEILQEGELMD